MKVGPWKIVLTRRRTIIIAICSVVLAAIIAYGIFWLVQKNAAEALAEETVADYLISQEEGNEMEELSLNGEKFISDAGGKFRVDWDGLREVNADVCAWIQVPAIPDISYPVVLYTDNNYYLRRSWRGDYLTAGCIMEDYHCSADFTDFHTILYGHNMDTGTMFGQLKKFQDQSFYDSNDDTVIIYTPGANLYYTIFSVQVVEPDDPSVYTVGDFSQSEALDFAEGLKNSSQIETEITADGNDRILTLSTCSGVGATRRLTVHAKLVTAVDTDGKDVTSQFLRGVRDETTEQPT